MRALVLALLLAGCGSTGGAPISYGGEARRGPQPSWAEGEGTPLSAYALRPEDVQPYDPRETPRTHRVGADESLYDIATAYQIPLRALIDQNRLEPPFTLSPGRVIDLPPPRLHRVERGESFEDVARRYNVDLRSLALMNRMQPPYSVRVGDVIVLPALARPRNTQPAPRDVSGQTPPPSPTPAPIADARFSRPVGGEIVARYGAQSDGRRLDGIELAASEGEPILAAADGDVVYAGDDLPAYGTLVLIRHADNYVTAYGYASRADVREGERVRAGARIGAVGSRERVLFQVRRGAEPVDPAPLLR